MTQASQTANVVTPILSAVVDARADGAVVVPGGDFLLRAQFVRSGHDLILVGEDGTRVVVAGWFDTDAPPSLATATGAVIPADLAMILAGPVAPGQYAQAGTASDVGLQPIGIVSKLSGAATVRHADGTTAPLAVNSKIFAGDVIETGEGGAVGMIMADRSTFALGAKARMVMDSMVYDPNNPQDSHSTFSVVQGSFTFVSGEVAKAAPDAMTVRTPVMTIGIRGTTVAGFAAAEGSENTVTLLDQGGGVGQIAITTAAGTTVMSQPFESVQLTSFSLPPPPPVILAASQVQALYGDAINVRPPPPPPGENPLAPGNDQPQDGEGAQQEGGAPAEGEGQQQEGGAQEGEGQGEGLPEGPQGQLGPEGPIDPFAILGEGGPIDFLSAFEMFDPEAILGFSGLPNQLDFTFGPDPFGTGGSYVDQLFGPGGFADAAFQAFLDQLEYDDEAFKPDFADLISDFDDFIELGVDSETQTSAPGENTSFREHGAYYDEFLNQHVDATIGGADVVNGGDGTDQLVVDAMENMRVELVTDGSTLSSGTVTFYTASMNSATVASTLTYSGVEQFLFADTAVFSSFISANETTYGDGPQDQGTYRAFVGLGTGAKGYAYAGSSASDTFTVAADAGGFLVFGKGGGDQFIISYGADMMLIGGNQDNVDGNSDGFIDTAVNVFDFSGLSGPTELTENAGDSGLLLNVRGNVGIGGTDFEALDRVGVASSPPTSKMNALGWNAGTLVLTAGKDVVNTAADAVTFGQLATLDLGEGDNVATIGLGDSGSIHSLLAGTGNDVVSMDGGTGAKADYINLGDGTNVLTANLTGGGEIHSVVGGAGVDTVSFFGDAASLGNVVSLDGGGGADALYLYGDYSAGITLSAVAKFEAIYLGDASHTDGAFSITLADSTAAASTTLTVSGFNNTNGFSVDGSAETDAILTLWGGTGNDTLTGGYGSDSLTGASGDDTLSGGIGTDKMTGGIGADQFRFEGVPAGGSAAVMANMGTDEITDFDSSQDSIALSDATFGLGNSGALTLNGTLFIDTDGTLDTNYGTGGGVVALQNGLNVDLYYCQDLANADTTSYQFAQLTNTTTTGMGNSNFVLVA
jgi:Ca2+-binding RTX toxin-like protein